MARGHASRRARRTVAVTASVGLLATGLGIGTGTGTASAAPGDKPARSGQSDVRHIGDDISNGKPLPLSKEGAGGSGSKSDEFKVGTVRKWPALDDKNDVNYTKQFVLRGIGNNVEVWVAKDIAFPAGDCRNQVGGGEGVVVTDAQVASFVHEFDSNIYPVEKEVFSKPPTRDGKSTSLSNLYANFYNLPSRSFQGDGDRIVTLVDNVRDQNFYDPTAADGKTYIAGFHYSLFNEYTNRNVMTLDAWDWTHRTGNGGTDNSTDTDYAACSAAIGRPFGDPRPHTYEGTFAHEYQHLLEYYESPGEANFINEGLSDWAQTLVGYVDPSLDPADPAADGHLQTWMGFNDDPAFGGPEQSLTRWQDQGAPEILSDYGMAYSFMEYLHSHFDTPFMTDLHRENANGFVGLANVMKAHNVSGTPLDLIHDFLASMAVDQQIEGGTKTLVKGDAAKLNTETMSARINWTTPQAYSSPGAPTNGADWIAVPGGDGQYSFDGAEGYPALPVQWTKAADGRLFSGTANNLDRAIARKISVPTGNSTVTFDLEYQTEATWDFAFVQVYDPTEKKWVSLSNANATFNADPQATAAVRANLPGFTGSSGGVTTQSFDLSKYAGQDVFVAVRYVSDGSVNEPGVWLSGMSVGGTAVADATDLSKWTSPTGAVPVPVNSWTVQLVGWDASNVSVVTLPLGAGSTWSGDVSDTLGIAAPQFAGFIVTANDPTLAVSQYADYTLGTSAAATSTTSSSTSQAKPGKKG